MPTYEFTCCSCKHRFDTFTSISGKSLIRCPKCGGGDLKECYGAFFVGGQISNQSAGRGSGCAGSCHSCGGSCKT